MEDLLNNTSSVLTETLSYLGGTLVYIKPILAFLAIILIGGFIVRKFLKLLETLLHKSKVDQLIKKSGLSDELEKIGLKISASKLITNIVAIIAKLILWMAAINVLGIPALTNLMNDLLAYTPNILIAFVLLFAGVSISKFVKKHIKDSAKSFSMQKETVLLMAEASRIGILALTVMAALTQLRIAEDLVQTLFIGIVAVLAIAFGLAFGLGGQYKAREVIEDIWKK